MHWNLVQVITGLVRPAGCLPNITTPTVILHVCQYCKNQACLYNDMFNCTVNSYIANIESAISLLLNNTAYSTFFLNIFTANISGYAVS